MRRMPLVLKEGRVSLFFSEEGLRIEVYDQIAGVEFAEVQLDPHQTVQALSRLAHTPCYVELRGLDCVGKRQEHKRFEFQLPFDPPWGQRNEVASAEIDRVCPKGWEPDHYFGSRESFFEKDGNPWARTILRRWVKDDTPADRSP